jgi:hypothetical protein
VITGRGSSAQERERGTGGLQADGPEASTRVRPTIIKTSTPAGPTQWEGKTKQTNNNTVGPEICAPGETYIIEIARGIIRQPMGTGYGYSIKSRTQGRRQGAGEADDGSGFQEFRDARFDFGPWPAEPQAAGADQPVGAVPPGAGNIRKIETQRRGRRAAAEQPRPGGEVG